MNVRSTSSEMRSAVAKVVIGVAVVLAIRDVHAGDAFDDVKCGGLVANALVGKHLGNGPVEATEKKHADLGLKHEGSDEISDSLTYEAWTLCGGSYHLLVRGDVIRGVVRADHSRAAPAFIGECKVDGKPMSVVFAILKPSSPVVGHAAENDHTLIPARRAPGELTRRTGNSSKQARAA